MYLMKIRLISPQKLQENSNVNSFFQVIKDTQQRIQTEVNRRDIINDKQGRHTDCTLTTDKMSGI